CVSHAGFDPNAPTMWAGTWENSAANNWHGFFAVGLSYGMNGRLGAANGGIWPPPNEAAFGSPAATVLFAHSWGGEWGGKGCGHGGIAAGGSPQQGDDGIGIGDNNPMTNCTAADTPPGGQIINPHGWTHSPVAFRHQGQANVVWVDGHSKVVKRA